MLCAQRYGYLKKKPSAMIDARPSIYHTGDAQARYPKCPTETDRGSVARRAPRRQSSAAPVCVCMSVKGAVGR